MPAVSKIPESLEANLDGLEVGDSIHISSIKLEEGVKPTISERDFTIATIAPPTVMKVEDEEKPADGEETSEESAESTAESTGDDKAEKTDDKKENESSKS